MSSAPRQRGLAISGSSPSLLVLMGVIITVLLVGLVVYELLTAYRSYTSIQADVDALDRLEVALTRLDERLSLSALRAASSGDAVWEERYASTEPVLETVFREAAAALDTTQSGLEFRHIRAAHLERVQTERRAMQLARRGDSAGAVRLLSGSDYDNSRRVYIESISLALQHLNDREEDNGRLLREKLKTIALLTGGVGAVAWLSIIGALQVNFRRRRAAETVLRESEARYRAVTEAAFDDILLTRGGLIREASDKFARMFGYEPEELDGLPLLQLIAPDDRDLVERAQSSGYDRPYEAVCVRKDGSRFPVEICGKSASHGGKPALVAAVRDISERKYAEAEREALIRDLRQKNDELERFSYTVSHDLKSPLITIKGFLKWVERDAVTGNAERLTENIRRICGAADTMENLMNSLLEHSRNANRPARREPVPFAELAREAVELVHGRMAQRGVKVVVAADLPVVQGDRARLLEVVLNLLDNATKFMGDQAEPRVEIGLRQRGREPVIFVRDNGIGIAREDQKRVLSLFERGNTPAAGTGVGLALAKRIIEQHDGTFWLESDGPGKGTTFCFRLPVVEAAEVIEPEGLIRTSS